MARVWQLHCAVSHWRCAGVHSQCSRQTTSVPVSGSAGVGVECIHNTGPSTDPQLGHRFLCMPESQLLLHTEPMPPSSTHWCFNKGHIFQNSFTLSPKLFLSTPDEGLCDLSRHQDRENTCLQGSTCCKCSLPNKSHTEATESCTGQDSTPLTNSFLGSKQPLKGLLRPYPMQQISNASSTDKEGGTENSHISCFATGTMPVAARLSTLLSTALHLPRGQTTAHLLHTAGSGLFSRYISLGCRPSPGSQCC